MVRKNEDEASIDGHEGKQVGEVEFDYQNWPIERSDNERFIAPTRALFCS
jgi:hypothetical protein